MTLEQATAVTTLRVLLDGDWYPAEEVARGAAYALFAHASGAGFLPTRGRAPGTRTGASCTRPTCSRCRGPVSDTPDGPLYAPVSRALDWPAVHRMSQRPAAESLIGEIRRTATVRPGTRMVKVLSARQLAGHLRGWLPCGFCYREYDVAHLRTPAELAVLHGDGEPAGDAVFALRWRAVDARDYEIPTADRYRGLVVMPPHDRVGPPVIGTGFAPATRDLIPEFVTADLADLPLTANASLVAYTADGTEVTLYSYLPEQRAWTRMFGPQWRHLLADAAVPAEQEYFPTEPGPVRFVGTYHGEAYEAVADPPDEFRVLAKTRAARYPVDALARRCGYATWRGAQCTLVRAEQYWLRVRLTRPDASARTASSAACTRRGRPPPK